MYATMNATRDTTTPQTADGADPSFAGARYRVRTNLRRQFDVSLPNEDIANPTADNYQDAMFAFLQYLRNEGVSVAPDASESEIERLVLEHISVYLSCYRIATVNEKRSRLGRGATSPKFVGVSDWDRVDLPMHAQGNFDAMIEAIEASEILGFLKQRLGPQFTQDLDGFARIMSICAAEPGFTMDNKLRQRLNRYRERWGLAFELGGRSQSGRRSSDHADRHPPTMALASLTQAADAEAAQTAVVAHQANLDAAAEFRRKARRTRAQQN